MRERKCGQAGHKMRLCGALAWHALVNALLADLADVARLYYIISLDASATLVVVVSSAVMAVRFLNVPLSFALDRSSRPEVLAAPGCALAASAWTALAYVAHKKESWTAVFFVLAECGIVVWSSAIDASRVRSITDMQEAAEQQAHQLSAFFVGTALALLLGGVFATFLNATAVFALCALACWLVACAAPRLPGACPLLTQQQQRPVRDVVAETLRAAVPYAALSNAVLAVPASTDAVVYFLAHTRGFTAMHMGLLGFAACVASALAAVAAEKALAKYGKSMVVVAGLINCAAALALTTLASTSESAERIPMVVRAFSACVSAAAQTALCVPFSVTAAKELARKGERRSAVNACVQAVGGLGTIVSVVATVGMCSEFRISAGDLSGVLPLLHVDAVLTPLPMLVMLE